MEVDLATCEIVGDSILEIVYICDPIVTADIRDIEHVEKIYPYSQTFEVSPEVTFYLSILRFSDNQIRDADIHSLI